MADPPGFALQAPMAPSGYLGSPLLPLDFQMAGSEFQMVQPAPLQQQQQGSPGRPQRARHARAAQQAGLVGLGGRMGVPHHDSGNSSNESQQTRLGATARNPGTLPGLDAAAAGLGSRLPAGADKAGSSSSSIAPTPELQAGF